MAIRRPPEGTVAHRIHLGDGVGLYPKSARETGQTGLCRIQGEGSRWETLHPGFRIFAKSPNTGISLKNQRHGREERRMQSARTTPMKTTATKRDVSQDPRLTKSTGLFRQRPEGLSRHRTEDRPAKVDQRSGSDTDIDSPPELSWLEQLDRIRSDAAKESAEYVSRCDVGQGGE